MTKINNGHKIIFITELLILISCYNIFKISLLTPLNLSKVPENTEYFMILKKKITNQSTLLKMMKLLFYSKLLVYNKEKKFNLFKQILIMIVLKKNILNSKKIKDQYFYISTLDLNLGNKNISKENQILTKKSANSLINLLLIPN